MYIFCKKINVFQKLFPSKTVDFQISNTLSKMVVLKAQSIQNNLLENYSANAFTFRKALQNNWVIGT